MERFARGERLIRRDSIIVGFRPRSKSDKSRYRRRTGESGNDWTRKMYNFMARLRDAVHANLHSRSDKLKLRKGVSLGYTESKEIFPCRVSTILNISVQLS